MALSENARVALIGGVAAATAFFVFGGLQAIGGGGASEVPPIAAVPRESFLVAEVDFAELRRSPLYEVAFGKEGGPRRADAILDARALGLAKLGEACGFDPLGRVDRLAVAVPEEGDRGELGVAAKVTVTRDELLKCTDALATSRGGAAARSAPKQVGSFAVIEDARADSTPPRIGYGRGLLVAGRGAWFDAMLGAAEGQKPGLAAAAAHANLRSSLTSRPGWEKPTVLVSALLPRSLRDRLKSEMGAEASEGGSAAIMAGVLGVSAAGVALRAGAPGKTSDAAVELVCDTEDGCAAVEKLILRKRLEWSKDITLRLVGFGPLLDSLDARRDGVRIRVTASASADALASTVERVLRLKGGRRDSGDRPPSPQPPPSLSPLPAGSAKAIEPDERIPARPAPSAPR